MFRTPPSKAPSKPAKKPIQPPSKAEKPSCMLTTMSDSCMPLKPSYKLSNARDSKPKIVRWSSCP